MDNFHTTTSRFDSLVQLRGLFAKHAKDIRAMVSMLSPGQ